MGAEKSLEEQANELNWDNHENEDDDEKKEVLEENE